MSIDHGGYPDYDLPDQVIASSSAQLKALADPLRSDLLDLVLDRAATVADLAQAVGRPKSTVAHHVAVLLDAGLLRVVRTRRVRAIDERFYGRTGRTILIEPGSVPPDPSAAGSGASGRHPLGKPHTDLLAQAATEAALNADLRCTFRHVRIPADQAKAFWQQVVQLADEFTRQPRSGDTVYGFAAGLFPTSKPVIPPPGSRDST